jgi:hypothetical protein
MSADLESPMPDAPAAEITLDDLRHKALHIRDEVRDEARDLVARRRVQMVAGAVVGLLVVVSVAYFVGTRMGRASIEALPSD